LDLENCFNFLISSGLSHRSLISATSQSAGAAILASVINRNPDLFKVAVLNVPFLNVL